MRDVAISWYDLSKRTAKTNIVPGDSHVRALPFLGMTGAAHSATGNHSIQNRYAMLGMTYIEEL